MTATYFDFPR